MAIKNLDLQLNEAGKIKIGIKGKMITSAHGNEFRPPQKLDHFLLTTTERDANGDYIIDEDLQNMLKEGSAYVNGKGDLVKLPIRLLYDDTELNFPTRYVSYVSGQLNCQGDGEKSWKRVNDFAKETPCPCARIEQGYSGKDKCKPTGTLTCIIDNAGYFGTAHKFRTTSMNTVKGILGGIELIKTATKGKIAGLPLLLTLTAKNTTTPGGQSTTIYVVSIVYRGSMSDLREEVLQLMQEEKQYLLTMGDIEAEAKAKNEGVGIDPGSEDEQDFVAEFFPGSVTETAAVVTVPVKEDTGPEQTEQLVDVQTEDVIVVDQVGTDTNTPIITVPAPAGPYADLYNRLLEETDYDAALKLANRLKKPDLIYFMETEYPTWDFDKTQLKPGILETIAEVLTRRFGLQLEEKTEVVTEPAKEESTPEVLEPGDKLSNHPFILELKAIGNSHIDVAKACCEYFKPIPVDRTQDIPGLIAMAMRRLEKEPIKFCAVCGERQYNCLSGAVCKNGHGGADTVYTDPNKPGTTVDVDTVVDEKYEPVKETVTEHPIKEESTEKAVYPREADDSGPIEKPQLRRLVFLKTALEKTGDIKPGKWADHVAYFLDKEGNPIKTAVDLTVTQGNNFITMLEEHVPF